MLRHFTNQKDKEALKKWFRCVDNTDHLPVLFFEEGAAEPSKKATVLNYGMFLYRTG